MGRRYLFLTPQSPQAQALARLVRRGDPSAVIHGGILAQDAWPKKAPYPFDALVSVSSEENCVGYDIVMPTTSQCTSKMIEWMGDFRVENVLFCADSLRVYDKPWLFGQAQECDVLVPKTWLHFDEVPDRSGPIFYKPKTEGTGERRSWAASKNRIPMSVRRERYLFQEKIPGKDVWGFGFIADRGTVIVSQIHREVCSWPSDGGSAVILRPAVDARVDELSRRLLSQLEYSGWGLVEWKFCPRKGDYVLMEVNAKGWASMELALRCEPGFANQLFSLAIAADRIEGLIWPWRLGCTIWSNALQGIPALFRYEWIREEGAFWRSLFSSLLPRFLKDYARSLWHFCADH